MNAMNPPLFGATNRQPPANIQAEQALLGAIFVNNRAADMVPFLLPEHFADPINGRIFAECRKLIEAGRVADAVTLNGILANTGILEPAGGTAYLTNLLTAMVGIIQAPDYGRAIHDAWLRRQVIEIAGEAADYAYGVDADMDGQAAVVQAVDRLLALEGIDNTTGPADLDSGLAAALEAAEQAHTGTARGGLMTGIPGLDGLWQGMFPGCLDILGARSEHGKTALATQIMRNVAEGFLAAGKGEKVGFWSLEMSRKDIATRMLAAETGIPSDDIRNGRIGGQRASMLMEARARLKPLPMLIEDRPGQTIADIQIGARVAVKRKGVRLIVIDHLHKIKATKAQERMTETAFIGSLTSDLKNLARVLQVPILALAQIGRGVEGRDDPRPKPSDLRYAGEADADNILLLWRPELHLGNRPPEPNHKLTAEKQNELTAAWWSRHDAVKGKAEVIGAKRRFGPVSSVWLNFDGPRTEFSDVTQEQAHQEEIAI